MSTRPWWTAFGVAVFAAACSKANRPPASAETPSMTQAASPSPMSASSAAPTQAALETAIIKQGLTRERATQLFTAVVGPLPGVAASITKPDKSEFDGTLAIGYLYQVWDSLTPDQRRAASRLIEAEPASGASHASSTAPQPSLVRLVSYVAAADSPAFNYIGLVTEANSALGGFMNVPPVETNTSIGYGTPLGTEYAHTSYWWKPVDDTTISKYLDWKTYLDGKCHIKIWNQRFLALDATSAQSVVTHEVMHCYQQRAAGTADNWTSVHPWIREGEPTWAMVVVVPGVRGGIIDPKWNLYVFGPKTPYKDRAYDALGVFGHESDLAGTQDVWPKLLPMVVAGEQGDDQSALDLLIQGRATSYYASWGSSYFEVQTHIPWDMFGPGDGPTTGPPPDHITVDQGTAEFLTPVPSYEAQLWQLDGSADIVVVSLLTGYGRLHDSDFNLDTQLDDGQPVALCLKSGGCKCPDGSPGASLFTKVANRPVSIGADGGDNQALLGVVGQSLDKFCKQPDPPIPPQQPGGGGGGGGGGPPPDTTTPKRQPEPPAHDRGDPHLLTFDGVYYDLQAIGEFTLVRSTKDDFTVQVRQIPAPGSRSVAVNQAMATRLGADRVSVAVENATAILRINGTVVDGPLPALKGGTITRATGMFGDTYELTWPDGTIVRAQQTRRNLDVQITPSPTRRGTLVGLLGDDNGSPHNDLIGLNGKHLDTSFTETDVNHTLADAWRITELQSLFSYQPGQSSATFTDRAFPGRDADPSAVKNRAAAEKYCQDLAIADQHLLDNCILDLAVTNDFVFGSEYAHAQQVLAARAALGAPRKAAGGWLNTIVMTGDYTPSFGSNDLVDTIKTPHPRFQFEGKQGDVIWIHADSACRDRLPQGHPIYLTLVDPTGAVVGTSEAGCDLGRRELPTTGTYTLRTGFGYHNESVRYRIPIHFVRHTRHETIAYGATVAGTIDTPGVRDLYSFSGQAGDVIKISGPGCSDGSMIITVVDPQGHAAGTIACRSDSDARLSTSGTYQIVVNDTDNLSGPYRFVFQGGKLR